jgi:two-component system chemotaxis response regulator CheY
MSDAPRAVLVVEDSPDQAGSLGHFLVLRGHHVALAGDGEQALTYLRTHPLPRLILLDLMLPVMDGWALLRERRADPRLAAVPVLVCSGVARGDGPADREELLSGCDGALRKPVEPDALDEAVRSLGH